MRDFFINSLEKILNVVVVLAAIALVIGAIAVAVGGGEGPGPMHGGGPLAALGVLIFGGIYLILIFGFMFLGLGIYQNTKRTAEAVEKLAMR